MAANGSCGPLWWDRELDSSGRQIRADVRAAAHEVWPNACRQAQSCRADMSEAAELMEKSVAQVSQYLDRAGADPFSQNTRGILMCAFCRALRRYAMKLNRLQLVGKSTEISERVLAPSWAALVEFRLDLERLGCHLTDRSRATLGLRSSGFDWNEIAAALHMSPTAARTAFWREIKRVAAKRATKSRKIA
jgi:DNA-directed RNA polymerase specialized sigma24 family protein